MISIRIIALLLVFMLLALPALAYETQTIKAKVTVEKDGFSATFVEATNITIATPPPEVVVSLWVTTPNGTAPYNGPYQNGSDIRVNVQAWLKNPGKECADRIIVEAPVMNVTSGQIELRKVIDTKPYAPNGWCTGGKLGSHWDYLAGFPLLDENGNPIV